MFLICFCSCLCPIHWSQVLSGEDVVAATTSEWSTVLLPTKVWLILEVWQYASIWFIDPKDIYRPSLFLQMMYNARPSALSVLTSPLDMCCSKFHWPFQGSKFHSSDHLRRVKMTVRQVQYLQDLSDGRLRISDFHISYIGFIYFRQVNGTFGQVNFTIHLPDRQVHSIWNFEACFYDFK